MKIIHKITQNEAIEAYKKINKLDDTITIEIENKGFINKDYTPVPMPPYPNNIYPNNPSIVYTTC